MKKSIKHKAKSNKFAAFGLAAFFAATGIFYILLSSAATSGTPPFGLYVAPWSGTVNTGSQINVKVYANLGSNSAQSIAAYLHYDPAKLRLDSANQAGVDPNFTVTSRCTSIDGCKPAGDIVFVAGYSGSGSISPADEILVGNMTFTALSSGSATISLDPDPKLSGFTPSTVPQSTLDTRTLLNGTYSLTAPSSGGGNTPPPPNAGGGTTNQGTGNNGGNTNTGSGTTKKSNGGSGTSGNTSNTGNSGVPANETAPATGPAATNNQNTKQSSSVGAESSSEGGPQNVSKPVLIAASAGLAALIVGTLMAAFSEPVRAAVLGAGHLLHPPHIQPAGHVLVGGPNPPPPPPAPVAKTTPSPTVDQPAKVTQPPSGQPVTGPVDAKGIVSHLDPPKTTNTKPSHGGAPGKIIEPTRPPTED